MTTETKTYAELPAGCELPAFHCLYADDESIDSPYSLLYDKINRAWVRVFPGAYGNDDDIICRPMTTQEIKGAGYYSHLSASNWMLCRRKEAPESFPELPRDAPPIPKWHELVSWGDWPRVGLRLDKYTKEWREIESSFTWTKDEVVVRQLDPEEIAALSRQFALKDCCKWICRMCDEGDTPIRDIERDEYVWRHSNDSVCLAEEIREHVFQENNGQ